MATLMTLQEVADYLRVTTKTVYRLLNKHGIPALKIGRQWRFDKNTIDEWLRTRSSDAIARILVIDDEVLIQSLLKDILEEQGHVVFCTGASHEGLGMVQEQDFDLVFLDLKMPGMNGAELFQHIKVIKPQLSVIIITGYPDSELMAQALAQGPFGIMYKPFSESDIITITNNFLGITQRELT